jgi:hypothetical protein
VWSCQSLFGFALVKGGEMCFEVCMGASNTYDTVLKEVSQSEVTRELAAFWQQKYEEILASGCVELVPESFDIERKDNVDIVPHARIVLCAHMSSSGSIDEDELMLTVERTVRLLDSMVSFCIDEMGDMSLHAKRNIAISIADIDEYLHKTHAINAEETVLHAASIVGNSAYRASEYLADEKGIFGLYEELPPQEVYSRFATLLSADGKEILQQENHTQETYRPGKAKPRRNMNIVDFTSQYASQWSDYTGRKQEAGATQSISTSEVKPQNIAVAISTPNAQKQYIDEDAAKRDTNDATLPSVSKPQRHIHEIFQHILKEQQNEKEESFQKKEEKKQEAVSADVLAVVQTYKIYVFVENNSTLLMQKTQNGLSIPYVECEVSGIHSLKIQEEFLQCHGLLLEYVQQFGFHMYAIQGIEELSLVYTANMESAHVSNHLVWTKNTTSELIDPVSRELIVRYTKERSVKAEGLNTAKNDDNPDSQLEENTQENINTQEQQEIAVSEEREPDKSKVTIPEFASFGFEKGTNTRLKYAIKLEQKLQTNAFGMVYIRFEYAKNCVQIETFSCELLEERDLHALNIIVSLVNFILLQGGGLVEIEQYLETHVQQDEHNVMNNFITVLLYCIKESPQNISELFELVHEE